jgi:GNAT superfamily N-acetyltransferase
VDEAALSIAPVTDADPAAVDAYLAARSDTCMFLRSNLRDAGLSWTLPRGAPLQAQHVVGRRGGEVIGVAAHGWNGVYTPPELRGRGHARAVVATSLIDARAAGATRAILFTPRPNAVAAYRAVGFAPIGHYAVVLFAM